MDRISYSGSEVRIKFFFFLFFLGGGVLPTNLIVKMIITRNYTRVTGIVGGLELLDFHQSLPA